MAGLIGMMYLLRYRAERRGLTEGFAMRSLPGLRSTDHLMDQAILLGFVLFTFATILGSVSAYQTWGRYWAWDSKETWALIVWLTYAVYFHLRNANHCRGVRVAWRVIIGFAITAICFFGVNLLFSSLHPYGQLRLWRAG